MSNGSYSQQNGVYVKNIGQKQSMQCPVKPLMNGSTWVFVHVHLLVAISSTFSAATSISIQSELKLFCHYSIFAKCTTCLAPEGLCPTTIASCKEISLYRIIARWYFEHDSNFVFSQCYLFWKITSSNFLFLHLLFQ